MGQLDVLSIGFGSEFDHIAQVTALPRLGGTSSLIGSFRDLAKKYYGGCSENIAITTAILGLKTGCIAAVGKEFGLNRVQHLLKHGIDLEGLIIREDETSAHCILLFDAIGRDVKIGVSGTANRNLGNFAPDPKLILRSRSIAISVVDDDGYCLKSVEIATGQGIPLYLASPLRFDKQTVRKWLSLTDVWILNHFEMRVLCQQMNVKRERDFLEFGLSSIIVTKGKDGCNIFTQDVAKTIRVSAVPPRMLVCPIGCGDAFAGGVVAGLVKGYDIIAAAKIGATVASFVLEKTGCQRGQPSWNQMKRRYKRHYQEDLSRLT